jgi:hypothetical protein
MAACAAACAQIPQAELNALLASQGVTAPWRVKQNGNRTIGWAVTVRSQLKEIGPELCTTHRLEFEAEQATNGYQLYRVSDIHEVALNNCSRVSSEEFVPVISEDRNLDDREIRRAIETISRVLHAATTNDPSIIFHYDEEGHRNLLLHHTDESKISEIIAHEPQTVTVALDISGDPFRVLNLTYAFESGRLLKDVYISISTQIIAR